MKCDISMRDVVGYEGLYAVTSCGKVWSYKSKIFLKTNPVGENKYLQVTLRKDGERQNFLVHRLVAIAYLDNPNNLPYVDHIEHDGTWHPEYLKNLKWVTAENNCCNRPGSLPVFDLTTASSYCSIGMAARRTGHGESTVRRSCRKFHANRKMKPPRYIFWEDMTFDIFRKYFPQL